MSQATIDAVRGFADLSREDVDYAGGKGANLGELTAAGFPVPPGFVVGAPAYAAFCDGGGLRERIERRLAGGRRRRHRGARTRRRDVRAEVEAEPLPEWLAEAVARGPRAARRRRRRDGGRGALLGHRRGHRVGQLRRHERDDPQRARRRRDPGGRAPLLGLAVRRAHDLLPRQARLRPGRHGHRRRRPAPDPLDPGGRDVHDRTGLGRARPAGDRGRLRARRVGRLRLGLARPLRRRQAEAQRHPARSAAQGADDRADRAAAARARASSASTSPSSRC